MAQAFTADPERGGDLVGWMEPVEIELVVEVMEQVHALLSEPDDEPAGGDLFASLAASMREREAPSDPALRRLLPDGHAADDEASTEFRRLTEGTIRQQKSDNLATAVAAFGRALGREGAAEVVLSRPEGRAAMMALTDVRLVLAERLGIRSDEDAEALHELVERLEIPRDERELTAMTYDFVTWLSESLTIAYLGRG